jgi:hypothetical protein
MEPELSSHDEREIRAARNQSLFRAVNEQIEHMNQALATLTGSFAITCECADASCIETIDLSPGQYEAIRAQPRCFAVLPGHVYPNVEDVVRESDGFVVVEKNATAGDVAEVLDPRRPAE